MIPENGKSGFFETAWQRLPFIRARARQRAANMPRNITRADVDSETVLAEMRKTVDYWAKAKALSEHRELLEHVIQPDLVTSVNRLFSDNAQPHQISFDRGVIYVFFSLFDKLAKADTELPRYQAALTNAENEIAGIEKP